MGPLCIPLLSSSDSWDYVEPCLPCARVSVENPRTVNPKPLSPHGAFPLEKSHSSDHMPRLDCPSVSAETLNPSSLLDTRRMKSKPKESEPFTRHGLQRLFEFKQVVSATLVAVSVFFKLITLKTELWTLSNRSSGIFPFILNFSGCSS